MVEKHLGKILNAEFGFDKDYLHLYGLYLTFEFDGCGVCGTMVTNISDGCKWDELDGRKNALENQALNINKVLKDAKVNYVSQLKGKPVEIELDNNMFKSFRILTEVL